MLVGKWRKLRLDINKYLTLADWSVSGSAILMEGVPAVAGQPEPILNDQSTLSTALVNSTVLHLALVNGKEKGPTILSAIK